MQVRIISGRHGGRFIDTPPGYATHPMSEKLRGAIFNMLGDITELSILDAFAGSGAIAFEAESRGAQEIYAVDSDKNAYEIIKQNAALLGSRVQVSQANIRSWLNNTRKTFDVIFCDPPYNQVKRELLIHVSSFVNKNGVIVYSLPSDDDFLLPTTDFTVLSSKIHGRARIVVFRKIR